MEVIRSLLSTEPANLSTVDIFDIGTGLGKLIQMANRQAILDYENERPKHHMKNEEIREDIYKILCKIYMRIRDSREHNLDRLEKTGYPKAEMPPVGVDSPDRDKLLSMNEVAGWYNNETGFLGKFRIDCYDPVDHPSETDPCWYSHMLCDLYDTFLYREDLYEKAQKEFGLVDADPSRLSSYLAKYRS